MSQTGILEEPIAEVVGREKDGDLLNWKECWYPVTFVQDLPENQPFGFSVYDHPMVVFRDGDNNLGCLLDRCPHRAAKLSDGQIMDGRLECLYHGWQFEASGRCAAIPQWTPKYDVPERAHMVPYTVAERQGIVWVWPGSPDTADMSAIPTVEGLDRADVESVDFVMDLPYDQSYLIENVIDIAHIHIAHDGIRGGGHRELAKPLEFDVVENNIHGIRSKFRTVGLESAGGPALRDASVEFIAPNLILYESDYQDSDLMSGLALYSIPLGRGRCRLIYRAYSNFWRTKDRLKPRWYQHWTQCKILEQDMNVVVGQHTWHETSGGHLRDLWLPIKSSDQLVVQYRKWLDKYGKNLPFYRGFSTANMAESSVAGQDGHTAAFDRYTLHTRNCQSCQRAHDIAKRLQRWSVIAVVSCLAAGIVFAGSAVSVALALVALVSVGGYFAAGAARKQFEENHLA